jgi:hypothetical protein
VRELFSLCRPPKKFKATFTKDFCEKNALKLPDLEDKISEIATIR